MSKRLLPPLLPVLSACGDYLRDLPGPTPISFEDDPRILRGVWTGQLRTADADISQTLRLDLTATYVNFSGYAVGGSATLGARVFGVEGRVVGGSEHSYLCPQTSPVPSGARLTLRASDGETAHTLACGVPGASVTEPLWTCSLDATSPSFDLKRNTP